jgi:PTS system nitrogen regulatory IIA component
MRLAEMVHPEMVWANLKSGDKNSVISELAGRICANLPPLSADEITAVLLNRENLGSTGIQDGVAIPHAKVKGLEKVLVACGRSQKGIDFDAPDRKPTHLFFVLLAPEQSAAMHLKILARLSRLLKDHEFRSRLLQAKGSEDIYRMIVEEDERQ